MKPAAIAVDIGDTDSPTQYEPIPYPSANYHWSEQQLPLHYMSEETARRRIKISGGAALGSPLPKESYEHYDDESKDVYSKFRPPSARIASGRLPQPHQPPPTSIVSLVFMRDIHSKTHPASARLHSPKRRAPPSNHLHSSLLLDPLLQNWCFKHSRLGRGTLWKICVPLHQTRILLRCSSAAGQNARWPCGTFIWI